MTTPPYQVDALSIEDGLELASWRYPAPWAVHDSLEAPPPDEGYWAVRDAAGRLTGFCCFGEAARVPGLAADPGRLDVALGLRPDLVGRGLGPEFVRAVVGHAERVASGRRLRCVVPAWNEAGRRAAETAGFALAGAHEVPGGAAVASYLVFLRG
jgi:[ribosomal protein S18]-alanine N-acetyltransferase